MNGSSLITCSLRGHFFYAQPISFLLSCAFFSRPQLCNFHNLDLARCYSAFRATPLPAPSIMNTYAWHSGAAEFCFPGEPVPSASSSGGLVGSRQRLRSQSLFSLDEGGGGAAAALPGDDSLRARRGRRHIAVGPYNLRPARTWSYCELLRR